MATSRQSGQILTSSHRTSCRRDPRDYSKASFEAADDLSEAKDALDSRVSRRHRSWRVRSHRPGNHSPGRRCPMTLDTILHGDCTNVMRRIADRSVDFVLTDPPYLCNYRSRDGETVRNDRKGDWIYPAFRHIHRVMKPDSFCVSFYGWHKADEFIGAWRRAGFRLAGHIVFQKRYASSTTLPAGHARTSLSAGQGRAGHAGTSRSRMCWNGNTPATSCTRRRSRSVP